MTQAQRAAVERSGQDVCVVAGPGSGKTRVLIERFAWLVERRKIDPARILAITFTEKAAAEIKKRLRSRLNASVERAWVATIDGFCARLLRENAVAAGLPPDFAVLDEAAARKLQRQSADEALEGIFGERPEAMRRLLAALDLATEEDGRHPDLARALLDIYEAMRVSGAAELPLPQPQDVLPRARERAREILADQFASGASLPKLRQWAECLLSLPRAVSREHFALLAELAEVALNRLSRNSTAAAAARDLKHGIAPLLEQQWIAEWNQDLLDLLRRAVSAVAERYRERKRSQAALDFADLEECAIRLLQSNARVREQTRARFDEILMDELQDTNGLQWKLIGLVRGNLFAVGDINQSIYGFRHAEPAVFEQYRGDLLRRGCAVDELRENHRSRDPILAAVTRVLEGAEGIEPRPLIGMRGAGPEVERMVASGEEANEVEASMIAERILELAAGGRKFCEIAILVRTMTAARPIERALELAGIPFLASGGRTFLEAREIRDVMNLLAVLANPLDEIALIGVLRSPLAGLSDEEIFRIGRDGWMREFQRLFGDLRSRAAYTPPDLLLASALDDCGYMAQLAGRAQSNLDKFLAALRARRPGTLAEALEEMEWLRVLQTEAEAPPAEAGEAVRVLSMHAAKGLEFPVVFVSALHRGPDPRKPVIAFSASAGLGAKWRNPATGKGVSDTAHARIVEEWKRKDRAEENRLLYVAMTRAEDLLILSHAERVQASPWLDLVSRIPVTRASAGVRETPRLPAPPRAASGPRFVDPPKVANQHDSSAAATAVADFAACPRRYLLSSIDTRPAGPSAGAVELGLEVHRVLAGGAGSAEAVKLAARFHASDVGRRAARATRIEREFDFLVPVEDVLVRGQIDLWFEEAGELILVDYKTDRDDSRGELYTVQLSLYAIALQRYAGRLPDRTVLFYLRANQTVEIKVDVEQAAEAVRSFRDAQESLNYPIRPSEQCRRCKFYQNRCPAQLFAAGGF